MYHLCLSLVILPIHTKYTIIPFQPPLPFNFPEALHDRGEELLAGGHPRGGSVCQGVPAGDSGQQGEGGPHQKPLLDGGGLQPVHGESEQITQSQVRVIYYVI